MIRRSSSSSGSDNVSTRSARDRNASSTASAKFVVARNSTLGRSAATASMPASSASVARCTSTGLAPNEAADRRTAKLSTSSTSTTVCGRRAASSGMRVRHQLGDVALALAEQLAGKRVRVDLDVRRRAARGDRPRRRLRQPAGQRRLAGARRARQDDQPVRQAGHGGQRGPVQQRQQRVVEQPLLHPGRGEDVVPRPVVVVRGQGVDRQHTGRQRRHGVTAMSAW